MERFLLSADAARLMGVTPASVRDAALAGRLAVAARTERGVRLFRKRDVERFIREREQRVEKGDPRRAAADGEAP